MKRLNVGDTAENAQILSGFNSTSHQMSRSEGRLAAFRAA